MVFFRYGIRIFKHYHCVVWGFLDFFEFYQAKSQATGQKNLPYQFCILNNVFLFIFIFDESFVDKNQIVSSEHK